MSTPIATPAPAPKKRIVRRRKKQLTPKQKLVKESAEQRFKIEKLVFVWQEKLFSQPKTSAHTLQRAATYLQPKTYEEVIEERVVQEWCGYPLCDDAPKLQQVQKFKISLSRRKVYDQTELANYCSDACYHKSKYYTLQLSDEPVWYRDLNQTPTAHIVSKEDDFQTAVQQERKKFQLQKSSQEVREEYVQHLLGSVPKDTDGKFQIIEKTTVAPPTAPLNSQADVYDTIEGYRIEIKKDGKTPTTMILKKKKEGEVKAEQETKQEQINEPADGPIDPEDPDALFETMMMLKDMNMDKQDQPAASDTSPKQPPASSSTQTATAETKEAPAPVKSKDQVSSEPPNQTTNVIKVITPTTPPPKSKKSIKKKKKIPELSLFGTIWTMLDHMTTKATRIYLNELQNNHQRVDVSQLLASENDLMDEAIYLRGQIFSERILDTYGIIRAQLDIKENLEDDIVNVIKTFKLSDASMVALNPAQCYMMALVLIKSLADILLADSDWKLQFENCCKTVDQSTDMVDACVRVLKIASV
ncbi:hypothetical protein HMPREF1544_00381 [Mucor circinelloides 1006PhL]|uniref:RNA polymerase II subunit B1 CTD phosphatase RPAP2 homolog n=1 Tax=Mucor circinelloides f. circinelloides (strain 1006PhL) TaxID=1220926 RepID=S2JW33_MUCC1|nr:hypothetical protein HMPREF1544_00381 [Mucor circinelloides 1006PhL]